ncbi:MAG: nucleotidyl transferase AbiEii/AbiGii toxin family protein [Micropruina sp.]|nr:nucleotidyl transferase AbiEii/AbiGii toxin family protein [Micropruina sp.]
MRLGLATRTTKDLDLLRLDTATLTGPELQDLLDIALDQDLGDGCTFTKRPPRQVRVEDELPSTRRVVIDVHVDRSPFATATIDIVTSATQPAGNLEALAIRPVLGGAPFNISAVDLSRHAAEKTHACARLYAHERPASRVKYLIDLALLIERQLLEPAAFAKAVVSVSPSAITRFPQLNSRAHPPSGAPRSTAWPTKLASRPHPRSVLT